MQSFGLLGSVVSHLKDLIHICLEPAAQDRSRTFKILYAMSNNPYLAKDLIFFEKHCRILSNMSQMCVIIKSPRIQITQFNMFSTLRPMKK